MILCASPCIEKYIFSNICSTEGTEGTEGTKGIEGTAGTLNHPECGLTENLSLRQDFKE